MKYLLKIYHRYCSSQTKNLVGINIKKPTKEGYDKSQFLDYKIVNISAGNGGKGAIALLRLFCDPHGGPCGGNGGNGGHVQFQACDQTLDLRSLSTNIFGNPGENGMGKGMDGANGKHVSVKVPIGTYVKCFSTNEILADLTRNEQIFVAARGGEGGKGNRFFWSEEHRAPTIAEIGGKGEFRKLILEVKLLADVGLVGIPNAGKSTLLRALTRAKPKVAPYAFTTVRPHIGKIEFTDLNLNPLTICDIPGIIEDSHKNRGLGIEFLRHIERCHILAFIIDLSNDPIEQFYMLTNELNQYRPILLSIPRLIICNKMDLPGTRKSFEDFKNHLRVIKDRSSVFAISAMKSVNLNSIISEMRILKEKNILTLNQ